MRELDFRDYCLDFWGGIDVAEIYAVETRDINKAVKNNPEKFPNGYVIELSKEEKQEVVENFHHLSKLKYSPHLPKAFEDGEVIETTTKFEFTQGFAKVSRSIKKIKK